MSLRAELSMFVEGSSRFVLITVVETLGSAPREVGARMVVDDERIYGSIGGGNLEFDATRHARKLLDQAVGFERQTEFFGLGISRKQCCGGAVRLMYEVFCGDDVRLFKEALDVEPTIGRPRLLLSSLSSNTRPSIISRKRDIPSLPDAVWDAAQALNGFSDQASDLFGDGEKWFATRLDDDQQKVVLFGAGHVGKALVKCLQDLPFDIEWVDARANEFPSKVPHNTHVTVTDQYLRVVDEQLDSAYFVVMTHSHGLDYDLCLHILKKRSFGWLGLIGSDIKRQRFEQRLKKDAIDSFTLKRLVCPIGVPGIRGKFPAMIALATAAQLLEVMQKSHSMKDGTLIQHTGVGS